MFFGLCHGTRLYPVFYSVFPLFFPILLSPLKAFLTFAQPKRPSQHLTMCALSFFFLTPIRRPGIPVVYWLSNFWIFLIGHSRTMLRTLFIKAAHHNLHQIT
jgi:hypothetical protein